MPGRSGPKRSVNAASPFTESEPSVSPWKACSTQTTRGRRVAARPSLSAASTDSVPLVREERLADRRRRTADELLGEERRDRRDPHLRRVRRLELHRLDEPVAHTRVVAADVEHPEAAEPVEVAVRRPRRRGTRPPCAPSPGRSRSCAAPGSSAGSRTPRGGRAPLPTARPAARRARPRAKRTRALKRARAAGPRSPSAPAAARRP